MAQPGASARRRSTQASAHHIATRRFTAEENSTVAQGTITHLQTIAERHSTALRPHSTEAAGMAAGLFILR